MKYLLYVKDYYLPNFTIEKPLQVCSCIQEWVDGNVLNNICRETHTRTLWNKSELLYMRKQKIIKCF